MPISPYPRAGQRIAPSLLDDLLRDRIAACDYHGVPSQCKNIRFCDLDETMWDTVGDYKCGVLAKALVFWLSQQRNRLLEDYGDTKIPLPQCSDLEELALSQRTYNCLQRECGSGAQKLAGLTIADVLALPSFGITSLVDLLVSLESTYAHNAPDQREAARIYVTRLINAYPLLNRKLQTSLEYHLAQYDDFSVKAVWAQRARAAFDAKIDATQAQQLPLWPSPQPSLFESETPEPIVETETEIPDHDARVAGVLNALEDEFHAMSAAAHRFAAMLHQGFDQEKATAELARIHQAIQSFYGVESELKQLGSGLGEGEVLSPLPDIELLEFVDEIRAMAGAAEICADDPRLGSLIVFEEATLCEFFDTLAQRKLGVAAREETLRRLRELKIHIQTLSDMTVEEEVFDLIEAVRGQAPTERNGEVEARRYGWDGQGGATLQSLADEFNVSRERIRQICYHVENGFTTLRDLNPFVPALARALEFLAENAPARPAQLESELREAGLLRGPLSIKRLLRIAEKLGIQAPVFLEEMGAPANRYSIVARSAADLENAANDSEVLTGIVRLARKLVSHWGVANIEDIVERLRETHTQENADDAPDADLVTKLLEDESDFAWLDRESGWFWLSRRPRNRLLTQIEKVLSVAPCIRIAELRAATARNDRRQGFAPPQRVLLELCRQLPHCRAEDGEVICDAPPAPEAVLSSTEWFMAQVLREHGSIMQRVTFEARCAELGIGRATFYQYLAFNPIIHRFAQGVYGLVGAQVESGVVEAMAPQQHRQGRRGRVLKDFGWTGEGHIWLGYQLSQGSLNNGVVSVPSAMREFLSGEFALQAADGSSIGTLVCGETQAWGLGPFFRRRGAEAGDFMLIVLNRNERTATLSLGDETLLEEHQPQDENGDA